MRGQSIYHTPNKGGMTCREGSSAMGVMAKTWLSLGMIVLGMLEFWLAMKVFGKKPPSPKAKTLLKLHRVFGYVFLAYLIFVMVIGFILVNAFSQAGIEFSSRVITHIALALIVFILLVIKILFIRVYRQYRPAVPALGIMVVGGSVFVWMIAGLLYLVIL
jgi:hypothetical protein